MGEQYEIIHYEEDEQDILEEWLRSLRDPCGGIAVDCAVARLRGGNFVKGHFCRDEIKGCIDEAKARVMEHEMELKAVDA